MLFAQFLSPVPLEIWIDWMKCYHNRVPMHRFHLDCLDIIPVVDHYEGSGGIWRAFLWKCTDPLAMLRRFGVLTFKSEQCLSVNYCLKQNQKDFQRYTSCKVSLGTRLDHTRVARWEPWQVCRWRGNKTSQNNTFMLFEYTSIALNLKYILRLSKLNSSFHPGLANNCASTLPCVELGSFYRFPQSYSILARGAG